MTDLDELMRLFSTPRPSGSAAEQATAAAITAWLDARGITYREHRFRLRPFFIELLGIWLIVSRSALALAVLRRQGWRATLTAAVGMLGGTLDVTKGWPLVTWAGAQPGRSLLLSFGPPDAERELMICAHYDSKTELFDHGARRLFTSHLRLGIVLTILLGLIGPLDRFVAPRAARLALLIRALGILAALPLLVLAWGLGLHLALGRAAAPSSGAVDNGAACAILLALAARLAQDGPVPRHSRVTLALFGGEEVNMQGSRAYVREHAAQLRSTQVVNLEMMGQDGGYILWQADGDALRLAPTDPALNTEVSAAVQAVTGRTPALVSWINSDAGSFLMAGVPAVVLGSMDRKLGTSGIHTAGDSPERVKVAQLAEGVEIMAEIVRRFDRE